MEIVKSVGGEQGNLREGGGERERREGERECSYMYCSLDRFCDSLSKCHFWFASDAGTVILCTHSLDVCVCVCVWEKCGGGRGRPINKRTSCWTY